MRRFSPVLISAFVALSSCQPAPYGVQRTFEVASEPNAKCVSDAIMSVGAVELISTYDTEKHPSWTLWGERLPIAHGYVYRSQLRPTAIIGLLIEPNGSGKVRVHHYQSSPEKEAQSYAAPTRQLMEDVETKLAEMCNATLIGASLEEACHGCSLSNAPG